MDEKDYLGSYSSDVTLQHRVKKLVFGRKMDVRRLITHRFSLQEAAMGIETAASPQPDSLKVMIVISPTRHLGKK